MQKNFTPLHVAAEKGHKKVAQLLLKGGAAIDARGQVSCDVDYRCGMWIIKLYKYLCVCITFREEWCESIYIYYKLYTYS